MKYFVTIFSIFILSFGTLSCDSDSGGTGPGPDSTVNPDIGPGPDSTLLPDQTTPVDKYTVTVASSPENAQIWVDGKSTGATTPGNVEVTEGCYDIAVTLQGYHDWESLLCVNENTELDPIILHADNNIVEELKFIEGDWARTDSSSSGPREVTVYVAAPSENFDQYFSDYEAVLLGFYPAELGIPIKKVGDKYIVDWTDSYGRNLFSEINHGDITIHLTQSTSGSSVISEYIYEKQ